MYVVVFHELVDGSLGGELLLSGITTDAAGNVTGGYVINGAWEYRVVDGMVQAIGSHGVAHSYPVPPRMYVIVDWKRSRDHTSRFGDDYTDDILVARERLATHGVRTLPVTLTPAPKFDPDAHEYGDDDIPF